MCLCGVSFFTQNPVFVQFNHNSGAQFDDSEILTLLDEDMLDSPGEPKRRILRNALLQEAKP